MYQLTLGLLILISSTTAKCPFGTTYESAFNKLTPLLPRSQARQFRCYKYYSDRPLAFLDAEKSCNSIGGHLVAIQSAFENFYVSGIASATPTYWIGANILSSSGWTWTTGDSMDYTNWAAGQPNKSSTNQCGAIQNVDNKWIAESCSSTHPYMCTVDPDYYTIPTTPTPSPTPKPCGGLVCDSYTHQYEGDCRCYWYDGSMSEYWTYPQAIKQCARSSGSLVIIRSAAFDKFLSNKVRESSWDGAIGLTCNVTGDPSSCVWNDGTPMLPGYSNFLPGEPKYQYGYKEQIGSSSTYWGTCDKCQLAVYCGKDPVHSSMLLEGEREGLMRGDEVKSDSNSKSQT